MTRAMIDLADAIDVIKTPSNDSLLCYCTSSTLPSEDFNAYRVNKLLVIGKDACQSKA